MCLPEGTSLLPRGFNHCSPLTALFSHIAIRNKTEYGTQEPYIKVVFEEEKCNKYLFPEREWDVSVFNHMLNLFPHSEEEKHHPVEQKYWPENRYIEYIEERHQKSDHKSPRNRQPCKNQNHTSLCCLLHQITILHIDIENEKDLLCFTIFETDMCYSKVKFGDYTHFNFYLHSYSNSCKM